MKTLIEDIKERVQTLPVLPGTTARLINALVDPKTTVKQIVEIIQYDQNLTAEVLKLCNSAYFGLSRKITTLKEALTYLGSRQVLQLVFSVYCRSLLMDPQPGYDLAAGMLWEHSVAVGIGSEKISQKRHAELSNLVFTAGLLHDIGKVILDQALREQYEEVLRYVEENKVPFQDAEKVIIGISHEEVGQMIMEHWNLPEPLPSVCRYHGEPLECESDKKLTQDVVNIVHLADSMIITMGIGTGIDGLKYKVNSDLFQTYGFGAEELDRLHLEIIMEFEKIKKLYENK